MPSPAAAHGLKWDGTYVPVGLNLGYGLGRGPEDDSGAIVGAEASLVHLDRDWFWYGGYVDALYSVPSRETRFSIGPEVGLFCFGLDGGFLWADSKKGVVIRPMLTVALATLYYRHGTILDDPGDHFGEFGLLLKVPIWEASD